MFNMKTKLPMHIDYFKVHDDGTLERDGMTCFPWINEAGYIGARFDLVVDHTPIAKQPLAPCVDHSGFATARKTA